MSTGDVCSGGISREGKRECQVAGVVSDGPQEQRAPGQRPCGKDVSTKTEGPGKGPRVGTSGWSRVGEGREVKWAGATGWALGGPRLIGSSQVTTPGWLLSTPRQKGEGGEEGPS